MNILDYVMANPNTNIARQYGVEPVNVNTDMTFRDLGLLGLSMTPVVGDAMAAKEAYDELSKADPNYLAGGLLAGAALAGAIPIVGDIAAPPLKAAGRKVAQRLNQRGEMPTVYSNPMFNVTKGSDFFNPPRRDGGRAIDPAMTSEYSSTKAKVAPYDFRAETRSLGNLGRVKTVTPASQQGTTQYFTAGDRTLRDTEISKVGDVNLKRPVIAQGGPQYMQDEAWASHRGVMVPKQNVFEKALDRGEKIKLAYMPMGQRSGDFAKHQAELFSEVLYSSNIPAKSVSKLDEEMQKIMLAHTSRNVDRVNKQRKKKGLSEISMPSELPIPSVSSPAFREWFSNKAPESVRKPFIQRVDKSDLKNLEGVPDVGEIRFSLTVPELVNAPAFSSGYRFVTPDIEKGLLPASHSSYDTMLTKKAGTVAETYGDNIPWTISARDTALPRLKDRALKEGFKTGDNFLNIKPYTLPEDQRVFTMNPNTKQFVDQQYVDEAETYLETKRRFGQEMADMYNLGLIESFIRGGS